MSLAVHIEEVIQGQDLWKLRIHVSSLTENRQGEGSAQAPEHEATVGHMNTCLLASEFESLPKNFTGQKHHQGFLVLSSHPQCYLFT